MSLFAFINWLNNTPWSVALRGGDFLFPIIESFHILGLGISVGVIMWLDLRLLGVVMNHQSVTQLVEQLEKWAMAGFSVMFVSGLLLFYSEPLKCYTTLAFRIKVIMLIMACLNVLFFHSKVYPTVATWDRTDELPWQAKFVGFLSLFLWFGIIIAGRWTAYL